MSWLELALLIAALAGLFCGGFLVAQRPTFWLGLGVVLFKALMPILAKRMLPEDEAAWHAAIRRGEGDKWLKERWRKRRK